MPTIRELASGAHRQVEGKFAVRVKKPPQPYRSRPGLWFELRVGDQTGEIGVKVWGSENEEEVRKLYGSFAENDVVVLKGVYRIHGGIPQIVVSPGEGGEIRVCSPQEYAPHEFIMKTGKDVELMFASLLGIVETVKNPQVKQLLHSFFSDPDISRAFRQAPAAMSYHQNWIGGLLEHVLNVVAICETVCSLHPELDRDLLLAGALLHDIGKLREFELSSTIRISTEGQLLGHIVIGYEMVKKKIDGLSPFDPDLKNKVLHLILSHQGKLEYASPKEPMLPEAHALHYADECDAQTAYVLQQKRSANTESAWIWDSRTRRSIYVK